MLVIKGKAGKSLVLVEDYLGEDTLIVEARDLQLSKIASNYGKELVAIDIPSNGVYCQDRIIDILTNFYTKGEGRKKGYVDVVFYLNVDEDRIEAFKKFEQKLLDNEHLDYVKIILTVQADNEELEYIMVW